jgi:DNA-binding NarL/FixJ family response regulator
MTYEPRPRQPAQPARIVIVDDHELARAGLRSMLAQERDLAVVGEASNGTQALALCRRLSPDLILMDVRMPGLDGLAATAAIKQEYPATSVIVVTMYENPDYLVQALKAGAAGYLLKDATQREVVTAVRQVLRGEFPLHPHLATHLLQRLAREISREAQPLPERLTPREVVVLQLLAQGQTNREIARLLGVSVGTVKVHVQHIIAKLGVSDRTQAAVRAVELGLLTAPRR